MNEQMPDLSIANARTLSDAEVEVLADGLDAVGSEDAMLVEELDGFLTALVCGPEPVPPEEYLPLVFGRPLGELAAAGAPAQAVVDLVLRHRNALGVQLYEGESLTPVLEQDLEGRTRGHAWALGFLRGTELRADAWDELGDDPETEDLLDALIAMAAALDEGADFESEESLGDEDADEHEDEHEDEDGSERRSGREGARGPIDAAGLETAADEADAPPIPPEEREPLIEAMMESVLAVYDHFRERREQALAPPTVRRETPKVGRNDPCPCGSGRKYKQCCGR